MKEKILKILEREKIKCKYYKNCKEYEINSYTCNHEEDADGYCGIRTQMERKLEEKA